MASMKNAVLDMSGTVIDASGGAVSHVAPTLITARPVLALVERWQLELTVLHHRSPGSDAVATLADCIEELLEAVEAGRDICLQLTIAEAHAVSNIPLSTLRWLCNNRSEEVGARKHEGVWYLDRAKFASYLHARTNRPTPVGEMA
jgi:hypothetical protein